MIENLTGRHTNNSIFIKVTIDSELGSEVTVPIIIVIVIKTENYLKIFVTLL